LLEILNNKTHISFLKKKKISLKNDLYEELFEIASYLRDFLKFFIQKVITE